MHRKNWIHNIFIVDGLRTPIGSPFKSLKKNTAVDLAGMVIKSLLRQCKVPKASIDEVILGNVVSAGLGQNIARHAAIKAGLPVTVPAMTVNNVCGSGLQAIVLGAQALTLSEEQFVVCGGTESATYNPYYIEGDFEQSFNPRDVKDSLIQDGLQCHITNMHMGELVEAMAKRHQIKRQALDQFSLQSHRKAIIAQKYHAFKEEIIPVRLTAKTLLKKDDRPRKNLTIESFKSLRPAFVRGGTVTAGNSSAPSDGAAVCLLATKYALQRHKLLPKARIVDYATIANDPKKAFEASTDAVRAVLKKQQLTVKDIDLFEVAESFAAHTLLTQRKLKIPVKKLNIYGGDIAFGHPLGAAGARMIVTLIHALQREKCERGLAVISYGGGGATAMIVESA